MNRRESSASGGICYWNASLTSKAEIDRRFGAIGLASFAPKERTDHSALAQACLEYAGKRDTAVEKHKHPGKNGLSVINIERDDDMVHFTTSFGAKIVEGRVVTGRGYANESKLQTLFEQHKRVVTGSALGSSLVRLALHHLKGVSLKDSGGLYWIPETAMAEWDSITDAVERSALDGNKSTCYTLRTLMDEKATIAVKDAIISEINASLDALNAEIATGELGDEALTNRKKAANALHARCAMYEGILSEAMPTLHQAITQTEIAATTAALQALGSV